jgi:tRNA(adenine34) deaminase
MPGLGPCIYVFLDCGVYKTWIAGTSPAMTRIVMPAFMDQALEQARLAQDAGEVPVGCVVVRGDDVIARAGNRTLTDRDPTAHAELLAIRQAAAALGTERLTDCDLYVTLEPCAMCAAATSFARIRRLYYAAADPKGGAVDNGVRFFASPTCHHRPEVYGGINEREAGALLRGFFAARRGA